MSGRSGVAVWSLLGACAVLIVGAMAWLTHGVMRAEEERSLAESRAQLEERIRLALWRMDPLAAAVTIGENQRVLRPPAARDEDPLVKLRFRIGPDGKPAADGASAEDLAALAGLVGGDDGQRAFEKLSLAIRCDNLWMANSAYTETPAAQQAWAGKLPQQQQELSYNERVQRGKAVNDLVSQAGLSQLGAADPAQALGVSTGGFQPTWLADEPFLLRQAGAVIEGVWLDRAAFRARLLDEIAALLPLADLVPSRPGEEAGAMELASFPWRLVPGESAVASTGLRGPVVASLATGWLAVAVALVAGFALVAGIVRLSERRASFVSAVTHELRTPLTTFRLYSDMLAGGAVVDEAKRGGYFRTMRREADRLSHLVENVLAFSRIERRSKRPRRSRLDLRDLLESMRERFEERLAGAGLALRIEVEGEPRASADPAAIEHILFNLVDNAAKYAAGSRPAEVRLEARAADGCVILEVADHGPGIPRGERQRVFRAFHKSAAEAADSKPGVGLGLALSRRLARDMGGELECLDGPGGRFRLRLPAEC